MIWKTNFDAVMETLDSLPRNTNSTIHEEYTRSNRSEQERAPTTNQRRYTEPEQDRFETPVYNPPPIQADEIPPRLASTLEQIIRQLDILTQTVKVIEERLTINEHKTNKIENLHRQIVQQQIDNQAPVSKAPVVTYAESAIPAIKIHSKANVVEDADDRSQSSAEYSKDSSEDLHSSLEGVEDD
jgi:centriolar protein POC1